jgi:hypothetical protein
METINEIQPVVKKSPSLLRQIMDEVDELDAQKKEALLWRIKMEKALELSNQSDEVFKGKFESLTDEQIASIVSTNRKEAYNAEVHH